MTLSSMTFITGNLEAVEADREQPNHHPCA